MTLTRSILVYGKIPSKKNLLRRSRTGGMYRENTVALEIDSITIQMINQWGDLPALEHPDITVTQRVRRANSDRDNQLTTLLDCLQDAGVLVNDNIKHCNGRVLMLPAAVDSKLEEEAVILLEWNSLT